MNRSLVVLDHNGGQLANQLWNYCAIYALSLHIGAPCYNYAFFEYSRYFTIPVGNRFIEFLFHRTFYLGQVILGFGLAKRIWRRAYRLFVDITRWRFPMKLLISRTVPNFLGTYFLPPSEHATALPSVWLAEGGSLYFDGWLFRNPAGINRYREDIIRMLEPKKDIMKRVLHFMKEARSGNKTLVGVHFRQGDYREFKRGRFFVDERRIRSVIDQYVERYGLNLRDTRFILCSNGAIDTTAFAGLDIMMTSGNFIEDLFILARTKLVIGSDSTFGSLASYLGDIGHLVVTQSDIDWIYYDDQPIRVAENSQYFNNKYCLTTCNNPDLWTG